jgi:hypothetical protein
MHLTINRTSVIYSAAGILVATAVTASFLARLYLLRRREMRGGSKEAKAGESSEPSVMEELVEHNWVGF